MKTIPSTLPQGQGVYALSHEKSGSIYIGSTTNLRGRAAEWRYTMTSKDNRVKWFPSRNHEEYEFRVLLRTEGKTIEELRKFELLKIEQARTSNFNVLNKRAPQNKIEFTLDGLTGSPTFHATRLGRNPAHVVKQLHRGRTIEQALGLAPAPDYDHRSDWIKAMPVKLLRNGEPVTYLEACIYTGKSEKALRTWAKKEREANPDITVLNLE